MAVQFATTLAGEILHTTTVRRPICEAERRHLAKMDTGEWALVESWIAMLGFQNKVRVYSVHNRIGSHPTVAQALARFDRWLADTNQ